MLLSVWGFLGVFMLELGDLVPDKLPIRINRVTGEVRGPDNSVFFNTEPVVLYAYKYGPRCPVLIKAALYQIRQKLKSDTENGNRFTDEAFQSYARDTFMQMIAGIKFEEADLLASDDGMDGKCIATLRYLNYFVESQPDDTALDDTDPQIVGEDQSITEKSSPILNSSTQDS